MTTLGKQFLLGVVLLGIAINLFVWAGYSCSSPSWAKIIDLGSGSCAEFWFNRYQTLIAGFAALGGAWITVAAMRQQAETARADEADRRLTRYAASLGTTYGKYGDACSFIQNNGQTAALEYVKKN